MGVSENSGCLRFPLKGYYKGTIRVPLKGFYKGLEFPKIRGTLFLFWCPYNRILLFRVLLGSPTICGNSHNIKQS